MYGRDDFRLYLTATLVAGLLHAGYAGAAQGGNQGKEAFYRCRDSRGQQHLGQSIPPACMDRDVDILDDSGRVIRTMPGRASLEEQARLKAEAEQAQRAGEMARQRDRTLLATYLSVADIERLRDQRLELLEQQSEVTRQYIVNLHERERRLIQEAARFRPYNDKSGAPALPENLAEEIVNTVNGLQVYQQELAKNTDEQARVQQEFGDDIARFKELKGVN